MNINDHCLEIMTVREVNKVSPHSSFNRSHRLYETALH